MGVITVLAVAAGFLVAPFMHVHSAGVDAEHILREHSGALALHMHVAEGGGQSTILSSLEETARKLKWIAVKEVNPSELPALTSARTSPLEEPESRLRHREVDAPVHQEPPHLRLITPRGPPV